MAMQAIIIVQITHHPNFMTSSECMPVLRPGSYDDAWAEPGVKGDKPALVSDGQAQQVTVSDLSVAEQVIPVELSCVEQAVVVCNEGVPGVRQGLRKSLCNGLQWQSLRV